MDRIIKKEPDYHTGHERPYSSKDGGRPFHDTLKVWDARLGTELISLPAAEKNTTMYTAVFSPNGVVLAATNSELDTLFLFDCTFWPKLNSCYHPEQSLP